MHRRPPPGRATHHCRASATFNLAPRPDLTCSSLVTSQGSFLRFTHTRYLLLMQDNNSTPDSDPASALSWDSLQLYLRAWLDDIAAWLPSPHSNYSPLAEYGYVLTSHGSVAAYNLDHAFHCRSRLLIAHTFDSPSPRDPMFAT
eukprot:3473174-Pleurochrysis_carterae.AAC.1